MVNAFRSAFLLLKGCVIVLVIMFSCRQAESRVSDDFSPVTQVATSSSEETIGENNAIPIVVSKSTGDPICHSFAFSQVPESKDLFLGKLKMAADSGLCAGPQTLALFRMDWDKHRMLMLHPLIDVPQSIGPATITAAYDPYVAKFKNELWVAFECVGQHIPGTSTCVAPLEIKSGETERVDTSRLTIPIAGLDSDSKSPWSYSASTPKLLNYKQHLYLYWTAVQVDKAPPHRWNRIETRGTELQVDGTGRIWTKNHLGRPLPSHAPAANVEVMSPRHDDPLSDMEVDTEGMLPIDDKIIVLSSIGGAGPDKKLPCSKPIDKSPGCFRLEITRTGHPLGENSFYEEILVAPKLPANAAEYPRFVIGPNQETFLLVESHPVALEPAPHSRKKIATGLLLIPLPIQSLKFQKGL